MWRLRADKSTLFWLAVIALAATAVASGPKKNEPNQRKSGKNQRAKKNPAPPDKYGSAGRRRDSDNDSDTSNSSVQFGPDEVFVLEEPLKEQERVKVLKLRSSLRGSRQAAVQQEAPVEPPYKGQMYNMIAAMLYLIGLLTRHDTNEHRKQIAEAAAVASAEAGTATKPPPMILAEGQLPGQAEGLSMIEGVSKLMDEISKIIQDDMVATGDSKDPTEVQKDCRTVFVAGHFMDEIFGALMITAHELHYTDLFEEIDKKLDINDQLLNDVYDRQCTAVHSSGGRRGRDLFYEINSRHSRIKTLWTQVLNYGITDPDELLELSFRRLPLGQRHMPRWAREDNVGNAKLSRRRRRNRSKSRRQSSGPQQSPQVQAQSQRQSQEQSGRRPSTGIPQGHPPNRPPRSRSPKRPRPSGERSPASLPFRPSTTQSPASRPAQTPQPQGGRGRGIPQTRPSPTQPSAPRPTQAPRGRGQQQPQNQGGTHNVGSGERSIPDSQSPQPRGFNRSKRGLPRGGTERSIRSSAGGSRRGRPRGIDHTVHSSREVFPDGGVSRGVPGLIDDFAKTHLSSRKLSRRLISGGKAVLDRLSHRGRSQEQHQLRDLPQVSYETENLPAEPETYDDESYKMPATHSWFEFNWRPRLQEIFRDPELYTEARIDRKRGCINMYPSE